MMRFRFYAFFLCGMMACHTVTDPPAQLIPASKMESVLWDYLKADAYAADVLKKFNPALDDTFKNMKMQQAIFDHYHISSRQFYDSYRYYYSHPEMMMNILDSIESKQNREKRKIEINLNKARI